MIARALLGLGSNLGDRTGQIQQALALLATHPNIQILKTSSLYQTKPMGMAETNAGWFINAVVAVETSLSPQALLHACLDIEQQLGRQRTDQSSRALGYASRTLDIDLLLYDNDIIRDTTRESCLEIPHPRLHERAFALAPMCELAPDWFHPVLGKTLAELYQACPNRDTVVLLATTANQG